MRDRISCSALTTWEGRIRRPSRLHQWPAMLAKRVGSDQAVEKITLSGDAGLPRLSDAEQTMPRTCTYLGSRMQW